MSGAPAYKVALLLTRDPAIAPEEFSERWLASGPAVRGPGLLAHLHNAPAGRDVPIENAPPAPYDAVDEYLFHAAADAADFFGSKAFTADWLGPRTGLADPEISAICGQAHFVWDRGSGSDETAIKILTLPVRRTGLDAAAFADHWLNRHFPLALSGPGTPERLLRAVTCPADSALAAQFPRAPFDGIGNIVFESPAAMIAEFESEHYRNELAPDEPRFTDPVRSRAMMVRERSLLG